ncbi:MAG TPA: hypothetical protein VNL35_00590 [Chloroflexota bacterium]|nr:hypothetical protein [Chloroflexota bacterium]
MQGFNRRRTRLFVAAGVLLAAIVAVVIMVSAPHLSQSSAPPSRLPTIARGPSGSAPTAQVAPTGAATAGNSGALDSLVVCSSSDFDNRANRCRKSDSQLSAGNGGLTIDGDLSFPDYMSGTIRLLKRNGTSWKALGQITTTVYPDVVTIDSNTFVSVQVANLFSYAGQRSMPKCGTEWGIEVDDTQGLPLGDARFTYACR